MKEMHFYSVASDGALTFLHTETTTTSTQWRVRYNDIGTMEFNTDIYNDIVSYILQQENDIIIVQGDNSAWVHAETDITGDENNFMINGKTLNYLLNWRIVEPFEVTDTTENIIRDLITDSFMTAGSNFISNFSMASVIGDTTSTTYTIDKAKPLFEVVKELCAIDNLGFAIDIKNEGFIFKLYRGIDRTREQTDRPAVILSEDLKTLSDSEYIFMQDNYYSCGYYALTDEEADVTTWTEIVKDTATGFYRREKVLSATEETEATTELKDHKKTEEINGQAEVIYGTDYNLGDLVTVQRKIGNTLIIKNKRVIGVDIVIEPNNDSETPILEVIE